MSHAAASHPVLDREFLELRARILEVAAALDRLDRAGALTSGDPRVPLLEEAVEILRSPQTGRAERVQLNFSIPYDEAWRKTMFVAPR